MKKTFLFAAILLFISFTFSSCRSSEPHCQAYSKATVKADKTVAPI